MKHTHADAADRRLVTSQIEYYDRLAPHYDDVWRGDTACASDELAAWEADVIELQEWVRGLRPTGDVLEVACGTGNWTRELVTTARSVTAIDASPAMIEAARQKTASAGNVRFVVADALTWTSRQKYDLIFFGLWLSHVPPALIREHLDALRSAVKEGGCVCWFDNVRPRTRQPTLTDRESHIVQRRGPDGRIHEIVKCYDVARRFAEAFDGAFELQVHQTATRLFTCCEARMRRVTTS